MQKLILSTDVLLPLSILTIRLVVKIVARCAVCLLLTARLLSWKTLELPNKRHLTPTMEISLEYD